jgi:hypothetical protein
VAVKSGDDAMCLKSGVRRGIDNMTVKESMFGGSNGGSNGIKFGTATYGAFKNITIEDSYVKDVQYAAMAIESRQGADVDNVAFHRIEFAHVGAAFFIYLAQQAATHPIGDLPKLGSINNVTFTDIAGSTATWPNSPHQGSLITGHIFNGTTYPITKLAFTRVAVAFAGGSTAMPANPPEATPNQYPESNMFGDLPAWGYYLRHVNEVTRARRAWSPPTPARSCSPTTSRAWLARHRRADPQAGGFGPCVTARGAPCLRAARAGSAGRHRATPRRRRPRRSDPSPRARPRLARRRARRRVCARSSAP